MNKNLTKIVAITLGLSMAVGVGASIVTSNKQTHPVYADYSELYSATFTDVAAHGYTQNKTFTLGNKGWTASVSQVNSGVFYLGTNSSNADKGILNNNSTFSSVVTALKAADSTYNSNYQTAHAYSLLFENAYNSVTKVNFAWVGGNNAFQVYLFGDSGSGWVKLSNTNYATSGQSVAGNVEWTGSATNFAKFAVVARPGATGSTATSKTLRASTFTIFETQEQQGASLSVTAPNYLVDGTTGTITGTITNDNNYTITWSANDANVSFDPATSSSGVDVDVTFDGVATGTSPIVITGTLNDGNDTTGIKSIYALEHAGTQADPFSATDAKVFSHPDYLAQSGGDWYVQGYVVGTYQTNKGYYIDEDSTATSAPYKFEVYNNSGVVNSAGKEIIVGTSYIIAHGSMTYYENGSQCETAGSEIIDIDNGAVPSVVINGGNRIVDINDSLTLTATTENPDNATVTWSSDAPLIADINSSTGVVDLVDVGTAHITATITVDGKNYTHTIALTVQRCPVEIGKSYIISSVYSTITYYLSGVSGSIGTCSTSQNEAMILTVEAGNTDGSYAFKNNGVYLKAKNGNNLETESTLTNDSSWLVSNDGTKDLMYNVGQSTRLLSYNDNGHTGDNTKINRFAAYTSQQSSPIIFTEIVAPEVDEVFVYGDSSADANNETSIVKDFLYEVTYVDPNNTGTEAVSVTVLNSKDGPEGASVTTSPSGGTFSVTFTASDIYTVTVTSLEDSLKSHSMTIEIENIYVPNLPSYALYEGTTVAQNDPILLDGNYVVYYDGYALKADISNNRAQCVEMTPIGGNVYTEDSSILWRISRNNGDYYTIYNASEDKYLASTGTNNQAKLESDVTDNSLWTVEITNNGRFEFINKARAGVANKYLRNNGAFGFAAYSTSTGGALSLYKDKEKIEIENSVESVSALRFDYTSIEDIYSYTNTAIRFGGFISQAQWVQLNSESHITGYGIMVVETSNLLGQTIKQRYAAAKTNENTAEQAIAAICSTYSIGRNIQHKTNPTAANADQKAFMGVTGDYYIWTVKKTIGDGFTTDYNALAFILLDNGEIVFLNEIESTSAKDIASSVIPHTDNADPALSALEYMRDH